MSYVKDFDGWHPVKKAIDAKKHYPSFTVREIWWCNIGINVGNETDGKNRFCSRPIVIIRKFSRSLLWAVPLSTQVKQGNYYYNFEFQAKPQTAQLWQLRAIDAKRLRSNMGKMDEQEFEAMMQKLKLLI
jgi:mRNA interferase MazF